MSFPSTAWPRTSGDVDVIYLGVYTYRDLYLTAGLHLIYLALSIVGLLAWRTSMRAEDTMTLA